MSSAACNPAVMEPRSRPPGVALSGWGNFPLQTCRVYRPESERQVAKLFSSGAEASYIARGLGRSYGDASLNDAGGVILNDRNAHLIAFDEATGVLECEAGVSLADIVDVLLPRGFFLPVTPGTRHVTLGGAIAADVHGKNHHRCGTIASFLRSFRLLTAESDILECSREHNAEVFWATIGGMGLTGMLLTARLDMLPVDSGYVSVEYERAPDLDRALERFAATDSAAAYSVAWIDCLANGASLGRSILMRGEHVSRDELTARQRRDPFAVPGRERLSIPINAPSWLLNSPSVRAFNALYYRRHKNHRAVVPLRPFFYPLDGIRNWNRLYGRRGFVQYQFVLPHGQSRDGMREILEELVRSRRSSFLAVLKSMGDANDGMLSFPMRGHTLAIDLPWTGDDLVGFLRGLSAKVIQYGGRVYLAKDAVLNMEEFHLMYPNAERFKQIQRRLDPRGLIGSSLSRRIGLTGQT